MLQGPADQWANQFAAGNAEGDWADQFANQFADGTDPNQWMEEFAQDMDARAAAAEAGRHLLLLFPATLCRFQQCVT